MLPAPGATAACPPPEGAATTACGTLVGRGVGVGVEVGSGVGRRRGREDRDRRAAALRRRVVAADDFDVDGVVAVRRLNGGDQTLVQPGRHRVDHAVDALNCPAQRQIQRLRRGRDLNLVVENGVEDALRRAAAHQVVEGDAAEREGHGAIHPVAQRVGRGQPHARDRAAVVAEVIDVGLHGVRLSARDCAR